SPGKDCLDAVAVRRIGGGQTEINAIENCRRPKVPIREKLCQRGSAGRFQGDKAFVAPLAQGAQDGNGGGGLAHLCGSSQHEKQRCAAIERRSSRDCELTQAELLALAIENSAKVEDPAKVRLGAGGVGRQGAEHTRLRQHPILPARDKPTVGYAADDPAGRFAVARRSQKNVARNERHDAPAGRLDDERRRLRSHLESTDVAFKARRGKISVGIVRRNAPEDGRPLDAGGENAPLILTQASGHEAFSSSRACPPACPWRRRSPLWQGHV